MWCVKATGGSERLLVQAMHKRKFPSRSPTPHKCARPPRRKANEPKPNRIDAALLTDYGQRYQPKPTSPTTASQDQLVALTQWLMQLSRHKPWPKRRPNITKRPCLRAPPPSSWPTTSLRLWRWKNKSEPCSHKMPNCNSASIVYEIKGVGARTAWLVLAHMPELGQINRQEVAALAGLAPGPGKRTIERCAVSVAVVPKSAWPCYMAALSAAAVIRAESLSTSACVAKEKPPKCTHRVMRSTVWYMNHQLKALQATETDTKLQKF